MIYSIRKCLESNKVFFETMAALFLSVMALFVSYQQYSQTKIQTEIMRIQTKISKYQITPTFFIYMLNEKYKDDRYTESRIYIKRMNNMAMGLIVDPITALVVKNCEGTIYIKAENFFYDISSKGETIILVSKKNYERFQIFSERLKKQVPDDKDISVSFQTLLRIKYQNDFDVKESGVKHYLVDSSKLGEAEIINSSKYDNMKKKFENKVNEKLDFNPNGKVFDCEKVIQNIKGELGSENIGRFGTRQGKGKNGVRP